MINLWTIAAGVLALAAALAARRKLRAGTSIEPSASIGTVSDEWLSSERGRKDESW